MIGAIKVFNKRSCDGCVMAEDGSERGVRHQTQVFGERQPNCLTLDQPRTTVPGRTNRRRKELPR